MRIASVGRALPEHYYDQDTLLREFTRVSGAGPQSVSRLETFYRNTLVGGRHLALPIEAYEGLASFDEANDAFIRCAVDLGAQAITDALERGGFEPHEIDHLFFVSVTGVATPSIDARLVNRMGLRPDIRRTPIFGLGCVAGAAGISRTSDYLKAYPDHLAVLLSVELCSLTVQRRDLSVPNLIASGLFGDGAAAVVMTGNGREEIRPRVVATRSVFYPDTEKVMGWRIGSKGFHIMLSGDVPKLAGSIRDDVDAFLADHDLRLDEVRSFVCHPGGPRVLEAFQETLELPRQAVALTWESLQQLGNLSSASVLMVLRDTMEQRPPPRGSYGLILAMGPGFCSEFVLIRW